jgi:hypothetical protein
MLSRIMRDDLDWILFLVIVVILGLVLFLVLSLT